MMCIIKKLLKSQEKATKDRFLGIAHLKLTM